MVDSLEKKAAAGATPHNLPAAETYEKEFRYFPWGELIEEVKDTIVQVLPQNGHVLDLLCGPGYLLGEIRKHRPDGHYTGVDISNDYVSAASKKHPDIRFNQADVLQWQPPQKYDVVTCTGGLHHIPYEQQGTLLMKIADSLAENGVAIIADPLMEDFTDEAERKKVAAKLGYEYLVATIERGAPDDILQAAVQIMDNDVRGVEYKTSLSKIEPMFRKYFPHIEIHKKWPATDGVFGDYYFILRKSI